VSATVLIVDDEPGERAEEIAEETAKSGEVVADSIHPDELSRAVVEEADLILVDYRLHKWIDEHYADEADRPSEKQLIAERPGNGVALAAVVRSQLPKDDDRIRGVALLSANLTDLVKDFTPAATEHAAARFNSVEWAFDKDEIEGIPPLAHRIRSLAAAIRMLNEEWPKVEDESDRAAALYKLLGLPHEDWAVVAERDVHASQAPLNQYGSATHGLSILRWIAQRVLPYPTFLLDGRRLAMACGVSPDVVNDRRALAALESAFDKVWYQGPLADFLGPRWWRAGVRDVVREASGDTLPGPDIRAAVEERAQVGLPPLEPSGAVLEIDGKLNVIGVVPRERAVRIRPDDWPPFAETGWLSEEQLEKHPNMKDLVDPVDRERLGD
jgi:hypothetical protein